MTGADTPHGRMPMPSVSARHKALYTAVLGRGMGRRLALVASPGRKRRAWPLHARIHGRLW